MNGTKEGQLPTVRFLDRSGNQVPPDVNAWLSGKIHVDESGIDYRPGWLDHVIPSAQEHVQDIAESPKTKKSAPLFVKWTTAAVAPFLAAFGIAAGGNTQEVQADAEKTAPAPMIEQIDGLFS